ncbi:14 kDa phosphohistidine phosphatase isoform X2 [Pipistrellus kuhlii]|uniref:14 kDa phosphohistidine phosphatase n=1 Tax=Pipistrellus kuhlii TaxID=59472 RepID=A0A7J7RW26_PIPKU|nr:14 kDa phosphohistidine phosphatase isoform X2 [Pipistrellus kuhlii]KAF6280341.1 phosphohistidine phosphatase 1 [Pipistrellus kuhlii]
MAAPDLDQIPDVDIDPDGVFKYVLIRVHAAPAGQSKEIVRGYKWAEYHADIFDKVSGEMQQKGYGCECLGGGRISHQSQDKKIHVYGHSVPQEIYLAPARVVQWLSIDLGTRSPFDSQSPERGVQEAARQ